MRVCERCKGEKETTSKGFTSVDGTVYPDKTSQCYACKGEGTFPELDLLAIAAHFIASRGKNKNKLRAAFPSPSRGDVNLTRAYYVWRLARFHGGADMTMPMTADMLISGDPFKKELASMAEVVAKATFGTDKAAAFRWGRAFGMI